MSAEEWTLESLLG